MKPLNEIPDRVVDKESEIDQILKALNDCRDGLTDRGNDLKVEKDKVKDLEDSVASMLEQDKGRKIGQADSALKDLDDSIYDLNRQREEALKKLDVYKKSLQEALANKEEMGEEIFKQILEAHKKAIKETESELGDLDKKIR